MLGEASGAIWGRELLSGLVGGSVALLASLTIGFLWHRRNETHAPIAGLLFALAAVTVLPVATPLSVGLIIGLTLLGLAGLAQQITRKPMYGSLAALPAAWLISRQIAATEANWVPWFIAAAIVVAAPLVGAFSQRSSTEPWTAALFALFTLGIFLSVPDTEEALVLLGVAAPIGLTSVPKSRCTFGVLGSYLAVGLAMWVIAEGGTGRPASIIGATACLGFLIVDPVARAVKADRRTGLDMIPKAGRGLAGVTSIQAGLVGLTARTAGIAETTTVASVLASAFLVGATVALLLTRPSGTLNSRRTGGNGRVPGSGDWK